MAHPVRHAENSARKFGGKAEDYLRIHNWFDESKAFFPDFRHRALRHHAEGIFLAEKLFGVANEVPPSGPVALVHTGIPLNDVEGLLLESAAYRQASRILLPKQQDVRGRPLTPLHGGHVGLLCTAGMLNGVFGEGENRHMAHWRSLKFTDHWEEEEADGTRILHDRERFSHELTLVFANGKTQILTHEKKESE